MPTTRTLQSSGSSFRLSKCFVYLNATHTDGLVYWRRKPRVTTFQMSRTHIWSLQMTFYSHTQTIMICPLYMEPLLRHGGHTNLTSPAITVRGIVFLYAGGALYYKCQYLATLALSLTEAEFASMSDAGNSALSKIPTSRHGIHPIISDGNTSRQQQQRCNPNGNRTTANNSRTRHIHMKQFVILEWSKEDLISSTSCPSALNVAVL